MAKEKTANKKSKSFEETLWDSANKLRGSVEPSEYKHVVLSLIFLKFASDKFQERRQELIKEGKEKYIDMETFYTMKNVFFLPEESRWSYIQANAKQDDLAIKIDTALHTIEKNNKSLAGALPDNYFSRLGLERSKLAALVDIISNINTIADKSQDVVGRVYEYFLSKFALAEGKGKGEFYTPKQVVDLIVRIVEPFKGKVYDPCCGSGGMFVQSMKFVESHRGNTKNISIYGQEGTTATLKLAKMNLAIRGISANLGLKGDDTFFNDLHPNLKADYIMANPPFNQKDWRASGELTDDPRWKGFELPPTSNANFAWMLHILSKLSADGVAGFVMANMTLASQPGVEAQIRQKLIEDNYVTCIVSLPDKLFYTTPIPVSLWFLSKNKVAYCGKEREKELLFIDADGMGDMSSRTNRELTEDCISKISLAFQAWRRGEGYADQAGFCRSVSLDEIAQNAFSLHPASYIEIDSPGDEATKEELQISLRTLCRSNKDLENQLMGIGAPLRALVSRELLDGQSAFNLSFKEFKLSDILERSNERLGNRPEPEILTCTEQAGLILQRERFSKRVATENVEKYKIVRRTDIVYNPYLLWAGSIDQCWIVDLGITSPAYEVFKIKEPFDPYLVGFALTTSSMIMTYMGISVGTVTRRRRAAPERFLDLKIVLPELQEQERLGSILRDIAKMRVLGRHCEQNAKAMSKHVARLLLPQPTNELDTLCD